MNTTTHQTSHITPSVPQAAYAAALPVLVAEIRAHGNIDRACETASVPHSSFCKWRQRDAALDRTVRDAVQFAATDAVDYGKWVTQ